MEILGNGNPLQYYCLENPMDREAWQTAVHGVARTGHDLAIKPPNNSRGSYKYMMKVKEESEKVGLKLNI